MSVWKKYHRIFYGGLLFVFIISCIFFALDFGIAGSILLLVGVCIIYILKGKVICPECNTPLKVGDNYWSKYYTGFHLVLSKKCLKCGYDLDTDLL
jgi:hypothetical protein